MLKKMQKHDYIFIVALIVGATYSFMLFFQEPFYKDESFYPVIALRLINGDSLIQNEWHLTQFSAVFQYLPIKLWLSLKGSSDGIILFCRCAFLFIHSLTTCLIYRFFRKKEIWAVAAATMFYMYLPYGMFALSYGALIEVFWLLFVFSIYMLYKKASIPLMIFAGVCFGFSCICSPTLCVLYFVYVAAVIFWPKRDKFINRITKQKLNKTHKSEVSLTAIEEFNVYFKVKSFTFITLGVAIAAVVAVCFYLATGGTISAFINNIENLLGTSEYSLSADGYLVKIKYFFEAFNSISFNIPILLPAFFIALAFDKNKKDRIRRFMYVVGVIVLFVLYLFGVPLSSDIDLFVFSLPFAILSITCYILTENKNKHLFYCLWLPSVIAGMIQGFFSNTIFLSMGVMLAISNIAGVFFLKELYKEISTDKIKSNKQHSTTINNRMQMLCKVMVIAMCAQIVFQCCVNTYDKIPVKDSVSVDEGPYAGLYMATEKSDVYRKTLADIETIKTLTDENDPVLILSEYMWTYLCIDRPLAINTAWGSWKIYPENLKLYYEENPDHIPTCIYLSFVADYEYEEKLKRLDELFDYKLQDLSNGKLLIVTAYKAEEAITNSGDITI